MTITIRPSIAPNIPIAPAEVSQEYMNEMTNALRLYFRQIDNFTQIAAKTITVNQSATVLQYLGI